MRSCPPIDLVGITVLAGARGPWNAPRVHDLLQLLRSNRLHPLFFFFSSFFFLLRRRTTNKIVVIFFFPNKLHFSPSRQPQVSPPTAAIPATPAIMPLCHYCPRTHRAAAPCGARSHLPRPCSVINLSLPLAMVLLLWLLLLEDGWTREAKRE